MNSAEFRPIGWARDVLPPRPRSHLTNRMKWLVRAGIFVGVGASLALAGGDDGGVAAVNTPFVVFGYNDLGMHCMNGDYTDLIILPPFNTLHAQVIDRRENDPHIVSSGVTIEYRIMGNTHSSDKSNFWQFWPPQFGPVRPPNIGLTGNGLRGTMSPTGNRDFAATGIPVVPIDDLGRENPYPLANIVVKQNGQVMARTQAVVPVSTEMSCYLCHNNPGISTGVDILRKHDRLHGTNLENERPVLCARCHADNALGLPGDPTLPNLSSAMHTAHAPRMGMIQLPEVCYACHPGVRTQCQRDVHFANGVTCTDCHGNMVAVGSPNRRPWLDEPRCGNCHTRAGFEFEEPGKLFRESRGHRGVQCMTCHNSPHAITPTVTEVDNVQAINIQGHSGVINTCTVCHSQTPNDPFPHRLTDD